MSVFDKLKSTFKDIANKEEEKIIVQPPKINIETINVLSAEQIKICKKEFQKINEQLKYIRGIVENDSDALKKFIKEQKIKIQNQKNQGKQEQEEQQYTIQQDMQEINQIIKVVLDSIKKVEMQQSEAKSRIERYTPGRNNNDEQKLLNLQSKLQRSEQELRKIRQSESMQKEMLMTLKQQSQLYLEETRKMQQKIGKLEKDLIEKNNLIGNLNEQKKVLLEMKNTNTASEVEGLKNQAIQFQKRLALEQTKLQQKEKDIENLKKKLEQQRTNIEAIADELKEKEMKSKKVIEKYEKSKIEIRKYREQKAEIIKNLQIEVNALRERNEKLQSIQDVWKAKVEAKENQLEQARSKYENIVTNNIKSLNLEEEVVTLSECVKQQKQQLNIKEQKLKDLESNYLKLQQKRQSLLSVLDKPVKHEIRTLQKIHKALDGLYKEFIMQVYEQERSSTLQFERKITNIMANILELKEDLLL